MRYSKFFSNLNNVLSILFHHKKKKKRFTTFLYVLKISSNISLVKELKKLSSKRRQIFYFILSPVFFFFFQERERKNTTAYTLPIITLITIIYARNRYYNRIPCPPYQWNITQRRGYVTDPYLRSVYFQKLGCQEAQVTDTIIPFT